MKINSSINYTKQSLYGVALFQLTKKFRLISREVSEIQSI